MTVHLPRPSLTLSHQALAYLQSLSYWRETVRLFCLSPVGGIYWRNEIPDLNQFETLSADDQCMVWRLFAIGISICNGGALTSADQDFWERSRRQVPNCPLFQRAEVSQHERREDYRVDRRRPTFSEGLSVACWSRHDEWNRDWNSTEFPPRRDPARNQTVALGANHR
jgi:hypothetical protein